MTLRTITAAVLSAPHALAHAIAPGAPQPALPATAQNAATSASPSAAPAAAVASGPKPWFALSDNGMVLLGYPIQWEPLVQMSLKVGAALIVLVIAWTISAWIRRLIKRGAARAEFDPTLSGFLANAAKWAILTIAIVTCLGVFGVQTASFAAVIAALGLAIGLALQGTLSNIASGVLLLVFRPFKVGDSVVVAGQAGTVNEIDLFTTALDTADGRRVVVPNAQIAGAVIDNQSHHPRRRAELLLSVPFDVDTEATRRALIAAMHDAAHTPGALHDPAPEVAIVDFGKASIQWAVRVWARNQDVGAVRARLLEAAKRELDRAAIRTSAS